MQLAYLPIDLDIEEVEYEMEKYRQIMEPVEDTSIAVFLGKLTNHFGTPENHDEILDDYWRAVEDLPEYHLEQTYRNILNNCKWYPKISEIREAIPDNFHRQKITYQKIKSIHKRLQGAKNGQ